MFALLTACVTLWGPGLVVQVVTQTETASHQFTAATANAPCTIAVAAQMPYPITAIQPERQQTYRLKRTETMAVLQWEGTLYAAEKAAMRARWQRPAKHNRVWCAWLADAAGPSCATALLCGSRSPTCTRRACGLRTTRPTATTARAC